MLLYTVYTTLVRGKFFIMHLAMYEYLEINLLGILLLYVMVQSITKKHISGENGEEKNFQLMLITNALILLFDTFIYLLNGHKGKTVFILNQISSCAYYVLHAWFCYFWILYVFIRLHPRHKITVPEHAALLLPAIINTVLTVSSPWTRIIYYITEDNVYKRGPFMWITFAAAFCYCICNTFFIIHEMLHPSLIRNHRTYFSLLAFPLAPIIGFILQVKFYGLSIIWIFMAIDLLVLFIDMQNDLLSLDALTGLYNRRQVNLQLNWEVQHLHQINDFLFVAMLDVDHFKNINDEYGHITGDKALACVGKVLKKSCRKNDFISRYGGDEFLITGHIANMDDSCVVVNRITATLEAMNKTEGLPCELSLSIGCAIFSRNDAETTDSILNEADRRMYEVKQRNHCGR